MRRRSSATTSRRRGDRRSISAAARCARFFTENALYWLMEYRFDGLRFDAVHAITEPDWLDEMAAEVRATVEPDRHVHLVLEHDDNVAEHLRARFRCAVERRRASRAARAADRRERRLLRRLCRPAGRAAGALPRRGLRLSGRAIARIATASRAARRARDLPPTAFVLFLQNHDQIGNRAFGERLTALVDAASARGRDRIAAALSANSAALHGRGRRKHHAVPVLHRPSRRARRCGARRPAARVRELCGILRSGAPRENSRSERAETFERSLPAGRHAERGDAGRASIAGCSALRREHIVPHLAGARALGAERDRPGRRAGTLAARRRRGADARRQSRRRALRARAPGRRSDLRNRECGAKRWRTASSPAARTVAFLEPSGG